MELIEAKQILDYSRGFKYSSLQYCETDDILNYEILTNDNSSIMLISNGINSTKLHWAANNIESLINFITKINGSIYIEFIPPEFVDVLTSIGFIIHSEFMDFFNMNLENTETTEINDGDILFLKPDECEKASQLTKDCKNDSRGFYGDSTEWFSEWISSEHGKVIILKDEDKLLGLSCVSLYDFENEKGPILWIREIVVRSEHRGKGLGKKLFELAIAYGKSVGAKRGFLLCDVENKNAIGLYNKYGFFAKEGRGQINMIRSI